MNFSLCFPSRNRLNLLEGLLLSLEETTSEIDKIEALIAIDFDDHLTFRARHRFANRFRFVTFYPGMPQSNFSEGYYNYLARLSKGKYIMALNDDTAFRTVSWDRLCIERMEGYLADKPDRIAYGAIDDGLENHHGHGRYACFPLLSKAAVEGLGYLLPPPITTWGADIDLWRIFDQVGRIVDLTCCRIDHICYHTGTRERDEVSRSVERKCKLGNQCYDIAPDVERLRGIINASR